MNHHPSGLAFRRRLLRPDNRDDGRIEPRGQFGRRLPVVEPTPESSPFLTSQDVGRIQAPPAPELKFR